MQLTSKQIVDNGIIKGYCEAGIQQQGIDVRLISVSRLSGCAIVPAEGKTIIEKTTPIPSDKWGVNPNRFWHLEPGYYEVTFAEACEIPANCVLTFRTRSSLVRGGAIIYSGQFDGGFKTDHMGAFIHVIRPITIEENARVAQAVVEETYTVDADHLYNGQWQNDKQRQSQLDTEGVVSKLIELEALEAIKQMSRTSDQQTVVRTIAESVGCDEKTALLAYYKINN